MVRAMLHITPCLASPSSDQICAVRLVAHGLLFHKPSWAIRADMGLDHVQ